MKKFTKIEVSFIDDFVPFLRNFNAGSKDVAIDFIRESEKNLHEVDKSDITSRMCERLKTVLTPERWVSGSFIWDYSVDGGAFWEDIDTKWRQFLSKEMVGKTEFVGEVTVSDIQSLVPKSIQGKYFTVKDLSYNRPALKEFESYEWNIYTGSELKESGGKYLILSDYPEDKKMNWLMCGQKYWPRPLIKIWVPELNKAWWVFFNSAWVSDK